jgi:ribosome biogenesis protein MAK21
LEKFSLDPLEFVKAKALSAIHELLSKKPEQENNLLPLLVNKMGDLDRKIASKASYLLSLLLQKHPVMKQVVIKEVSRLLFRQHVTEKARYYAITFMNQIVLSNKDYDKLAAAEMVNIYFTVFEELVAKTRKDNGNDNGINAKLMAALLTGVNRAFPFSEIEDAV